MNDAKLFSQGQIAFGMDQHTKAVKLLDQAIKINAKLADYFYWRARAKQALKQYNEAVDDYDQAAKLKGSNLSAAEVYYWRGLAKYHLEQHYAAVANFNKVVTLNAQHADAFYYRGQTKKALKLFQEAIADYSQAITLNPQHVDAYLQRAALYEELEQYPEALSDYHYLVQARPHCATMVYNLATVKRLHGLKAEAIPDYTKVIELNADYSKAFRYRGMIQYDLKHYDQAMADFNRFLELEKDCKNCAPIGYYWRGNVYRVLNRYLEAVADYTKAIELEVEYSNAFRYQGLCQLELKQFDEALASFNRFVELEKECANCAPIAYTLRGNAYKALGQYQKAIADYEEALKRKSDYKEAKQQREAVLAEISKQEEIQAAVKGITEPLPQKIDQHEHSDLLGEDKDKVAQLTKALRQRDQHLQILEEKYEQQASLLKDLQQQVSTLQQALKERPKTSSLMLQSPILPLPYALSYRLILPPVIVENMRIVQEAGFHVLLVGGAVRDLLLGIQPEDADFITDAPEDILMRLFKSLKKNNFISHLFQLKSEHIDIDILCCDPQVFQQLADLKQEASKRDFTVNALYCDVQGFVYDPLAQGIHDLLVYRCLRVIGAERKRFEQDPVLLLKAARLVAFYGFQLLPDIALIQQLAPLLQHVDPYRLKLELKKLFLRGAAANGLMQLMQLGLLKPLFPQTEAFLTIPEGTFYQQWLYQALQQTDYLKTIQQPVSFTYVCALIVLGAVLAVSTPADRKLAISQSVEKYLTPFFQSHDLETVKQRLQSCLHHYEEAWEYAQQTVDNQNAQPSVTDPKSRHFFRRAPFWAHFLFTPKPSETLRLRRSYSYPTLAPQLTKKDAVEELLNDPTFIEDLTTFRTQLNTLK